jgi:hypothetical protein
MAPQGFDARSIAMQGAVPTPNGMAYGLKMINASLGNVDHGLPRSQGFTFLFDPESARPSIMMETAYISAMRTAGVTVATALETGGRSTGHSHSSAVEPSPRHISCWPSATCGSWRRSAFMMWCGPGVRTRRGHRGGQAASDAPIAVLAVARLP